MTSAKDSGSTVALAPAGAIDKASGLNVLSHDLILPLLGVPTLAAEVDIGDKPAPTGAQVLSFAIAGKPPLEFVVTIVESEVGIGRATVFAVGGAGGMRSTIPGRDYGEVSPRLVAEDIISAAGELPDAASLAALDALPHLPRWSRPAGTARAAMTRLAAALGMSWRVLPSGLVWLGAETWPAYTGGEKGQPYYTEEPDAAGLALLALEAPDLLPGMSLKPPDDQAKAGAVLLRVSDVIHAVDEEGAFRTRVRLVLPEATGQGRQRDQWVRAVRGALPPLDMRVPWPATVVSQDTDGTLGLHLDDGAPLLTLSAVPIWCGLPGITMTVPSGTRCVVEFLGGKETAPIVRSFAPDTAFTIITIGDKLGASLKSIARVGDSTDCGTVSATSLPGGGAVTFTVTPPTGPAQVGPSVPIAGLISSGMPFLKGGAP